MKIIFFCVALCALAVADIKVNEALFHLSLNLLDKNETQINSPFSVALALATINEGVTDDVSQEITDKAFQSLNKEIVNAWFKNKITLFKDQGPHIAIAAANFVQKGLKVSPTYLKSIQALFQCPTQEVDFRGHPEAQVSQINKFVSNATQGHINQLVTRLPRQTTFVNVNALFTELSFKSQFWKQDTKEADFYNEDGSVRKVEMMKKEESALFSENAEFAFLGANLNYDGGSPMNFVFEYTFFVIVPKNQTLESLKNQLTFNGSFSKLYQAAGRRKVDYAFPKFKAESSVNVKEKLEKLGIKKVFEAGADLSGIAEGVGHLDGIIHKAMIDVNEKGVTAAAASMSSMMFLSANYATDIPVFRADRPFLYGIVHEGLPLFVGQVY
ncbi:hypothetical protein L596_022293 [Steinernema carpocapsae]|uniref:Serpin domain-containing protein n=1 Tax=Steinernema carpocapsae TaxID=34508 RepID=A0A4U5MLC9_STECR|nr:hypothetical protein L596_022293 [Steinernema carpocapsae]